MMSNQVFVAPICQYSSKTDGLATSWHMVHLGTRAAGGAGLMVAEATAVQLAHPGRKASTAAPWTGTGFIRRDEGGWQSVAPSALP
jgi:2,4-dienoyl-CoA reductase-like NADH-dependent reductase (Old Yellow Enzyme family)